VVHREAVVLHQEDVQAMGHLVVAEGGDDVRAALADLVAEVVMALVVIAAITVLPQVEVGAPEVEV